jgi:hypothetical protein
LNENEDNPIRDDLKATSDSIRHDAERLARMEKTKSELSPSDPRVERMSRDIEQLISQIADKAKAERELADQENEDQRPPSRDLQRPPSRDN